MKTYIVNAYTVPDKKNEKPLYFNFRVFADTEVSAIDLVKNIIVLPKKDFFFKAVHPFYLK